MSPSVIGYAEKTVVQEEKLMSKIYTSVDQLIGKTPLLELVHIEQSEKLEAKILGKLEYFNPAGSVKDRIAKAMIDDAEQKGLLKPRPARLNMVWPQTGQSSFTGTSKVRKSQVGSPFRAMLFSQQ